MPTKTAQSRRNMKEQLEMEGENKDKNQTINGKSNFYFNCKI